RARWRRTQGERGATLPAAIRRCGPNQRRAPRYETGAPHPFRFPYENDGESPATKNEVGSNKSHFLWFCAQDSCDNVRHAVPVLGFRLQAALSGRRESVILGLALVFRLTPFTGNPAQVFQAVQCRVQGALLNLQPIFRNLLDA